MSRFVSCHVIVLVLLAAVPVLAVTVGENGQIFLSQEEEAELVQVLASYDMVPMLVATSDAVVVGRPVGFVEGVPRWYVPGEHSDLGKSFDTSNCQVMVEVSRLLKGTITSEKVVLNSHDCSVGGGKAMSMTEGLPSFTIGQELLLFLSRDLGAAYSVTAGWNGVYNLRGKAAANTFLELEVTADELLEKIEMLIAHPEKIQPPQLETLSLGRLREQLREAVEDQVKAFDPGGGVSYCRRETGLNPPYSPGCFQTDSCPYKYYYPYSSTSAAYSALSAAGYFYGCTGSYGWTKLDTSWRWSSSFCLPLPPGHFRWQGWVTTSKCTSVAQKATQGPEPNPEVCSYIPISLAWTAYVAWWHVYYC